MHKYADYQPLPVRELPFNGLMTPAFVIAEVICSTIASLRGNIAKKIETRRQARAIARTTAELSSLDDHVLKDIGVPRSDIYTVAYSVADQPHAGFYNFEIR